MASPASPTVSAPSKTSDTGVIKTVERDIVWIRTHILLLVFALAVVAGSVYGGIMLIGHLEEAHDARMAAQQLQREQVDAATQANLLAQLQKEHDADAVRDAQLISLIQSQQAIMEKEREDTRKQVNADATLNAKDAAARLALQTNAGPTDITVSGDNITMSLPLTRTVVVDLDNFAQAQKDVVNLSGQLVAQAQLTTDAKTQLDIANKVIAADKTELIATIKADNAACDVRVQKQADKDLKRGGILGVISFIGGLIARGAI